MGPVRHGRRRPAWGRLRGPGYLLLAAVLSGCALDGALAPRGSSAAIVAGVWWYMFWVATAVFVGWLAVLAWGVLRPRGQEEDPDHEARVHRRLIVGGGIVLPVIVLGSLFGYNLSALLALPQGGDVVVDVTGYQYWWEVAYPEAGFVTANEMYIPTETDVRVRLRSEDVIHSFWVPQLGGKRDMVPGHVNELTLRATEPGRYLGECAEFCGIQHANMRFEVVAVPAVEYDAWLARMARPAPAPDTPEERAGHAAFMTSSCAACHTVRGTPADGRLGPELTHFARRERLGAGVAPNERGHLGGWVVDSQTLKPGNLMPPVEVDARRLPELLTYLESLE
ncbi:MAG: cytochrome c oxidase subunit II [Actinomycetota bacterium]|nr:cytochrome c oxidase subunit II [Actinomycetota bacterium]